MNTPLEKSVADQPTVRAVRSPKAKPRTYLFLLAGWILLVTIGVLGAKWYADYLTKRIEQEIAAQTEQQLKAVQEDYQKQVSQLKESVTAEMAKMQTKINALNELLAFTKDSANNKTDNSNQLYTQLSEVKKKLDELKKNLDVLQ
jgi:esterase/lipase